MKDNFIQSFRVSLLWSASRPKILTVVRVAAFVALVFLTLSAPAANVTLAWSSDSSPGVAGYRLHYGTVPHSYSMRLPVSASTPSATVSNLQNGRTYYFAVTSTNAAGLESALSSEVSYTVPAASSANTSASPPSTNPPIVTVIAGANASEPRNLGSFLFTRTGDIAKALTIHFTLDGTAVPGVDYLNPGNTIIFGAGRSNATLLIRPIADKIFEGAKTVVLTLVDAANFETGDPDSASIFIGDDDRPRISISAPRSVTNDAGTVVWPGFRTKVHAAAYAGLTLILQRSTNLTQWIVVAAPLLEQPVDYVNGNPTATPTSFYRAIYVAGEITEASIAEALAHQMFSANIVGAVNVTLQPGWNLAANPLNGLPLDGPLGSLPGGTTFVPFNSSRANICNVGRWNRGVPLTRSTAGGWIYNPSNAPVNITYVGEVPALSTKPQIPAGWSVRSGVIDATVGNDLLLGYPLHAGDALYEFNPLGAGTNVWITHLRGVDGWDAPPMLTAGQGALIYKTKSTRASVVTAPAPPTPNLIKFVPLGNN